MRHYCANLLCYRFVNFIFYSCISLVHYPFINVMHSSTAQMSLFSSGKQIKKMKKTFYSVIMTWHYVSYFMTPWMDVYRTVSYVFLRMFLWGHVIFYRDESKRSIRLVLSRDELTPLASAVAPKHAVKLSWGRWWNAHKRTQAYTDVIAIAVVPITYCFDILSYLTTSRASNSMQMLLIQMSNRCDWSCCHARPQ